MEIIGLSGYAGAGKDTAADILVEHGFERIAFADVLREMALALDPYVLLDHEGTFLFERVSTVIDAVGWDTAKNRYPDVRRLLQRLGTEAGREILGDNIWVDTAFRNATSDRLVVTDMRFPNEGYGVRERGGITVRIHRPGVGPRNNHASETSMEDFPFDYHIDNDGSIDDLHKVIVDKLL